MTPRLLTKQMFCGTGAKLYHLGAPDPDLITNGHWAVRVAACRDPDAVRAALRRLTGIEDLTGDWGFQFVRERGAFKPQFARRPKSLARWPVRTSTQRLLAAAAVQPGTFLRPLPAEDRRSGDGTAIARAFQVGATRRRVWIPARYADEARRDFELCLPENSGFDTPVRLRREGRVVGVIMCGNYEQT